MFKKSFVEILKENLNKDSFKKKEILKDSNMKVHDIDCAIKLACTNYKSAFTNFKRGHIKPVLSPLYNNK